jgi:hypothetical protein
MHDFMKGNPGRPCDRRERTPRPTSVISIVALVSVLAVACSTGNAERAAGKDQRAVGPGSTPRRRSGAPTAQPGGRPTPTATENGQPLLERHGLLDGEVTFSASPPWEVGFAGPWGLWLDDKFDERVHVLADPLPIKAGCRLGPAPADAEALAQRIRSDPDLEATERVAVAVGRIEALRMDVVAATGASVCPDWEGPGVVRQTGVEDLDATVVLGGGQQMRLYLLDLPGGSAQILAIAIVAPEARFEGVVEAAAPILDSFEFRTG